MDIIDQHPSVSKSQVVTRYDLLVFLCQMFIYSSKIIGKFP